MYQYFVKYLILSMLAVVAPVCLLLAAGVLSQVILFSPVLLAVSGLGFWSVLFLCFFPVIGFLVFVRLAQFVKSEKHILSIEGPHKCLWVGSQMSSVFTPFKSSLTGSLVEGWDQSGPFLELVGEYLSLSEGWKELLGQGVLVCSSLLWSKLVLLLDQMLFFSPSTAFFFAIIGPIYYSIYMFGSLLRKVFFCWLFTLVVLFLTPADVIFDLVSTFLRVVVALRARDLDGHNMFLKWVNIRVKVWVEDFTICVEGLNTEVRRHYSGKIAGDRTRLVVLFRQSIIRSVQFIDSLALPEFIRSRFQWQFTPEEVISSRKIMSDLGWPVNVNFRDTGSHLASSSGWKDWLLGGSDFATGISALTTCHNKNLDHLRSIAIEYKRAESYQSVENELEATSRYFVNKEVAGMPDVSDELWEILGTIFRNSKLTPFNYIIKMWEKKYALGFWMKNPSGRGKHKRSRFISTIGYSNFKALWARTFYYASQILPVAHISVKGEALPPRKWAAGKVRSIIGSPISQYILSTIWNYGPNHNFDWQNTPIKVGMPLNGYWMSDLFARHGRYNIHVEGDFSSFDSTLDGPIIDMIKAVRKKGYDFHKDRTRICELIDINYDQVLHQNLGFTSTGDVYRKGTGLTTGHSSTSMDNSISLVVLYLAAWKELTGKSAKDFMFFNELSCFGDDHLLSILSSRPRIWSPRNIKKVMASWGVENNLEVKPLAKCEFLSKQCSRMNASQAAEIKSANLPSRAYAVWHNKGKLVGKLVAPLMNKNPTYQVKRLLSYLTLTAHHRDVYDGIIDAFKSRALRQALKESKLSLPSYEQVLRDWYRPSSQPYEPDPDPELMLRQDGRLVHFGVPTVGDLFLGCLSQVPDLLNPVVFNMGFAKAFQSQLAPNLVWIIDFLSSTNGAPTPGLLKYVLGGSPYFWLDTEVCVPGTSRSNFTSMLVRHWLFCFYCQFSQTHRTILIWEFILRKIANWQFLLNGYVHRDLPRFNTHFDRIIIAALLGACVHLPDWLSFLGDIHLPEFSLFIDFAWNYLVSSIWSNVPSNYNELNPLFAKGFGKNSPLLITAPTGTGKSTGLVNHLSTVSAIRFRKIIVIEPRSLLVVGLTSYMKRAFGLSCTGATHGSDFDPDQRVWYMTPESFLSRIHLVTKNDLVMFDECHINEPSYVLARRIVALLPLGQVWTSATPTESDKRKCKFFIDLPVASIWSVQVQDHRLISESFVNEWLNKAISLVSNATANEKFAVIVDTPDQAESVAKESCQPVQVLHSMSSKTIDTSCKVFVSTNIIDVGLTIPDLQAIHYPAWNYTGSGNRYALSNTMSRQRIGRVGRTCNGSVHVYHPPTALPNQPTSHSLKVEDWTNLLVSGIPAAVVNHFDPLALANILGIDRDQVTDSDWSSVVRAANVFLANMRPVFLGNQSALQDNTPLGDPVKLFGTGAGNISSSWPQPSTSYGQDALLATAAVIKQGLHLHSSAEELSALNRLSNVAGPVVRISQLANNLIADLTDGFSDMLNPKNREPTGTLADISEIPKILKLLREVSQLAEED